jgi:hypothetical protein
MRGPYAEEPKPAGTASSRTLRSKVPGPVCICPEVPVLHPLCSFHGMSGFCKLFAVIGNGLHACIRLACGQLPKHARSLDEIRAPYPEQIIGLRPTQPALKAGFQDAGSTNFVITCKSYANLRWMKHQSQSIVRSCCRRPIRRVAA